MGDVVEFHVRDSDRPALIDADLADLARYRWRLDTQKGHVYRYGNVRHWLRWDVLGGRPPEGYMVAFRNRNKLDFRRENLYVIEIAKYERPYSAQRRNVTGLRGVTLRRDTGRYVASVTIAGTMHYLGCFDTPEEADYVVKNFRVTHAPQILNLL